MFALETKIHGKGDAVVNEFDDFKAALHGAQHVADVVGKLMPLTRHSDNFGAPAHSGLYEDMYNEASITIRET